MRSETRVIELLDCQPPDMRANEKHPNKPSQRTRLVRQGGGRFREHDRCHRRRHVDRMCVLREHTVAREQQAHDTSPPSNLQARRQGSQRVSMATLRCPATALVPASGHWKPLWPGESSDWGIHDTQPTSYGTWNPRLWKRATPAPSVVAVTFTGIFKWTPVEGSGSTKSGSRSPPASVSRAKTVRWASGEPFASVLGGMSGEDSLQ